MNSDYFDETLSDADDKMPCHNTCIEIAVPLHIDILNVWRRYGNFCRCDHIDWGNYILCVDHLSAGNLKQNKSN